MASAMIEDTNYEDDQLAAMTTDEIVRASRLLGNEIRILKVQFSSQFLSSLLASFILAVTIYFSISQVTTYLRGTMFLHFLGNWIHFFFLTEVNCLFF